MPKNKLDKLFQTGTATRYLEQPYVIAEIGVNYEGSMDLAKRLVQEAKIGGADAVKFQTYKADTIASKDSPAYWDLNEEPTTSQHELFKKHEGFWLEEMRILKAYADELNIEFLSTPFDAESAVFLDELMPAYKISSSDITNKPFIRLIASFDKPILLSTGASELAEIHEAISWIYEVNQKIQVCLLHCVLNYPTPDEQASLGMIRGLIEKFPDLIIGYSDHTLPNDMRVCELAHTLGAQVIEKHFTHDKTLRGNDHYHAMDFRDLQHFRTNIDRNLNLVGRQTHVSSLPEERKARQNARRSLVAARPIASGHKMCIEDLTYKRPASGISPKYIDQLIGRSVLSEISEDTVLQWHMFAGSLSNED